MFDWGLLAFFFWIGIVTVVSAFVGGIGLFFWWLDVWWVTAIVLACFCTLIGAAVWPEIKEDWNRKGENDNA